jgi:hypothetical protein
MCKGKTSFGKAENVYKEQINKADAYLAHDLGTTEKRAFYLNVINVYGFKTLFLTVNKISGVKNTF